MVIGAGFAGLAAALHLSDRGVQVTLFEARERVGGRVWSTTLTNGAVVELGAEWIMQGDEELRSLAERFAIPLVDTGTDYKRREAWGPAAVSSAEQDEFLEQADRARASLTPSEAAGLSLGAFLDRLAGKERVRDVVKTRLEGTCAQDLGRVTVRVTDGDRAFASDGATYARMGPGNQRLAEAIAAEFGDLRLGRAVEAVEHSPDGVTVRCGPHSESADAVVVAVPAPVAARLSFTPALPQTLGVALAELPMGVASKFAVATKGRPSLRSRQWTELPMWCWAARGADGKPRRCLASFAGGARAQKGLGVVDGKIAPWLEALATINPDLTFAGEPVMYAWADDPYTMGAYSAWDDVSWDRHDDLARPVGRLAFAGEHTAGPEYHATMEGALRSGRRAAAQVVAALG